MMVHHKEHISVMMPKSIKEILDTAEIGRFRRWLLYKLIPKEFYEMPAIKLAELQKGAVIGKLTLEYEQSYSNDITLDIGVADEH